MTGLAEKLGLRLSHVGVAVPDLSQAAESMAELFGYQVMSGPFEDPIQQVTVIFLRQSAEDGSQVELVAPLGDDSPIRSVLSKGGPVTYHLCFETSDLEGALEHALDRGCVLISGPVPAVAFGGRRIAWIYTRTRQLFELVETAR